MGLRDGLHPSAQLFGRLRREQPRLSLRLLQCNALPVAQWLMVIRALTTAYDHLRPCYDSWEHAHKRMVKRARSRPHTHALTLAHTRLHRRHRFRPPARTGGRIGRAGERKEEGTLYSPRAGGCGYSSARGRAGCATVRPGAGPVPMPCLQIDEAEAKRVAADGAERTHLSEGEVRRRWAMLRGKDGGWLEAGGASTARQPWQPSEPVGSVELLRSL